MKVSIIILAAGEASRMGVPKQLLHIEGKSLIKRMAEMAMDTPCYPIVVVLGANRSIIRKELDRMPVTVIDNAMWEKGMSSSIKMGLVGAYMTLKEVEAAIFLTVDMPMVSVDLIQQMIQKAEETKEGEEAPLIVACKYENQLGIPVLFKRELFNELLELTGDNGAKKVLKAHPDKTAVVDFPQGKIDLDTMDEFRKFISNYNLN